MPEACVTFRKLNWSVLPPGGLAPYSHCTKGFLARRVGGMVFVFVASVLGEVLGNSQAKLVIRLSEGRGGWESCDYNR